MIEQDSMNLTINKTNKYEQFAYDTADQKEKKKKQKKRLFLAIMILCIPLLFSFSYIMLNKTHSIHYPTLNEVSTNPHIYQYLNGTVVFIDQEGSLRVHDNRQNKLNLIANYSTNQKKLKVLMNSWDNQLIINSVDAAQVKWVYINDILNFVQIESIEYLDKLGISDCNPQQSYPLIDNLYLLSCNKKLFIFDIKRQKYLSQFSDFYSQSVVLVKQTAVLNYFYIIFSSAQDQGTKDIISIYSLSVFTKEEQISLKLIYQGEHQLKLLRDIIIQNEFIILVFPQSIMKYKRIPSIIGLDFDLELIDNQFITLSKASLTQCFIMKNELLICYDENAKSLLQINQWEVNNTLNLDSYNLISIKIVCYDLYVLNEDSLLRITYLPLTISESFIYSQNGLNMKISDLIVINQTKLQIQCN